MENVLKPRRHEISLRVAGILSPYLAVCLGLFLFKNGLFSVLLYHSILLVCIVGINGKRTLKLIRSGFDWRIGPLVALGGLLPGVVIYFLWPAAKQDSVNIANLMKSIELTNIPFIIFALYSCCINPFIEESFWRGCFYFNSWKPNIIDALFAGYHAMVMIPVVKPIFVVLSFLALSIVSWIFRNIYRLTGGLAIPLITHLIADIAILWAIWKIIQ